MTFLRAKTCGEKTEFLFFYFLPSSFLSFLMNFTTFLSFNSFSGFEGLISDDCYDWIQILRVGKVGGIDEYMFQGSNLESIL